MVEAWTVAQLGQDLRFDDTLTVTPTKNFCLVYGTDNLVQAIKDRLKTRKGELFAHQEYGSSLWELLGRPITTSTVGLAKLYFLETIIAEPRIFQVINISAVVDSSNSTITLQGTALMRDEFSTVNIVYPFALNE